MPEPRRQLLLDYPDVEESESTSLTTVTRTKLPSCLIDEKSSDVGLSAGAFKLDAPEANIFWLTFPNKPCPPIFNDREVCLASPSDQL